MSDTGDNRERRDDEEPRPDTSAVPGEEPADPAYAAGSGFSGEATGATPADAETSVDTEPTAGPDPVGSAQPDPERPQDGGGANASRAAATGSPADPEPTAGPDPVGSAQPDPERPQDGGGAATARAPVSAVGGDDAKTMAMIAHVANILGVFTGGLGNLAALILALIKKDSSPDWIRTHYVLVIRTVLITLIATIAWVILFIPLGLLSITGVPFMILIPVLGFAIAAWVIARSVVGLIKLNANAAYPNPETWLI